MPDKLDNEPETGSTPPVPPPFPPAAAICCQPRFELPAVASTLDVLRSPFGIGHISTASLPVVVRFHDILRSQVSILNKSFIEAIEENKYEGRYTGVFPIKVNQMREVVEEVVDAGTNYNYGLEAGSKPELLAVLAYNTNRNSLTVLNGYKDHDYLRLAMLGTRMGRNTVIVIENFSEVNDILKISKEMKVRPMVGLRAKLSAKSRGKWAGSSGERAKFGLTVPEILESVRRDRCRVH